MRNLKLWSCLSRLSLLGAVFMLATLLFSAERMLVQAQTTGNKIAFSRNGELWVMNGDGSGQTELGLGAAQAYDPSWSPDGEKIAFTCGYESSGICVVDADGTNQAQLTSGVRAYNPAWSPDGTKIAFTMYDGTDPHIYLMNPDGSAQQPLFVNDPTIVATDSAAWSPDGTRIAFVGVSRSTTNPGTFNTNIYIVKVDGSEPPVVVVVGGGALETDIAWSPDGTKIAYVRPLGNSSIHIANIDGTPSGIAPLTDGEANLSPTWSPDGTQLAFFRQYVFRDENDDPISRHKGIYVLQVSTGIVTSINATDGETPAYRPAQQQPVPGPAERIQNLIKRIESFGLSHGITNSLTVKLRHALDAYNAGDTERACSELAAFINHAGALSGKKLTTAQASEVVTEAASIRAALGCQ